MLEILFSEILADPRGFSWRQEPELGANLLRNLLSKPRPLRFRKRSGCVGGNAHPPSDWLHFSSLSSSTCSDPHSCRYHGASGIESRTKQNDPSGIPFREADSCWVELGGSSRGFFLGSFVRRSSGTICCDVAWNQSGGHVRIGIRIVRGFVVTKSKMARNSLLMNSLRVPARSFKRLFHPVRIDPTPTANFNIER